MTLKTLRINIFSIGGNHWGISQLDRQSTVLALKEAIQASTAIPVVEQRLVLHCAELSNTDVIDEVSKQDDLDISLIRRSEEECLWLKIVSAQGVKLRTAPDHIRASRDVVYAAVQSTVTALQHASEEIRSDHGFVLDLGRENVRALEYAAESLYADRGFMRAALALNGRLLSRASPDLRKDQEVACIAIKQNCDAFRHVDRELQADRSFVLALVSQNGLLISCLSADFREDRDIVLAAVRHTGVALAFAPSLFTDREIVIEALSQNGLALASLPADLRADRELVLVAVAQNGEALEFSSQGLRADPHVISCAAPQARADCQDAVVRLDSCQ